MKLSKKQIDLKECIQKERVITNGIGGFCSSTVLGLNTRRYHGLLVESLLPPAQRHVILSKLDESLQIGEKKYNLFTNMCENYVSDGYKHLYSFEKEILPEYTFKIEDTKIVKKISMIHGRNTVVVQYKIQNGKMPSKLTLAPSVNFRDFHHMSTNRTFEIKQK